MIKAVLFDMIGTTVMEADPDLIINCFQKAFLQWDLQPEITILQANRGKNKFEIIRETLRQMNMPMAPAENILHTFNELLEDNLNNFAENEFVPEVFAFLKKRKIQIGIGSGLPSSLCNKIYDYLGWKRYEIDYINNAETIGKSRPDPAMIFDMMNQLQITSPKEILKIGDTVADIQEGKNAGAFTAAILSGTQQEHILREEKPDFILSSLQELTTIPFILK